LLAQTGTSCEKSAREPLWDLLARTLLERKAEVEMAQRAMEDAVGGAGIGKVLALAGALAIGCGGNASPDDGADDSTRQAASGSESAAPGGVSGADPAPAAPPPAILIIDEPAPAPAPASNPVQLTTDTVRLGVNGGEVDATLFLARSPQGTTLELIETGERICVRGELAPVPGGDFANYWGGEVGLVLASSPPTDVAPPGDGLDTPGFGFRLEGTLPPQLRLRVGAAGEVPVYSQYCQDVVASVGSSIEIALESLTFECWVYGGARYPGASSATLVSWQIPALPEIAGPFDFCIEDIHALSP
jgi:hypothetical protein